MKPAKKLSDEDEMLRLLIASVVDYAIIRLAPDGTVLTWNEGAQRIKGYSADEIIGQHFSRFYSAADNKAGKPTLELKQATSAGRSEDQGWRLRKDGTRFSANVVITSLKDKTGKLRGFVKVTRDISDRLKIEESLRKSEESFRLLVSSVVDYAIIMLAPDGTILTWNNGAKRIKGYTADEIIGQHFSRFYSAEDNDAGKPALELTEAASQGRFEDLGWRVRKDGSRFFANVVITALRDDSGTLLGFSKVTRDITQRKSDEEALQQARDIAIAASRFKSEFLCNMSHEIRTPMNGIMGMTEILLRSPLTASQSRYAVAIKESCAALLAVINDVLDFSKIEAGKLVIETVDVEPIKLVESVGELLATPAKLKGITLLTFIDPQIPLVVRADPMRLRQILINFVGNAIKFAEKGNVVVRASLENGGVRKINEIKFSVTDQGLGMTEEQIANLFKPFVQADGSMTRKYGGSGLGLSICKKLVDLMKGQIGVRSVKDHGSTFWFSVPFEASPSFAEDKSSISDLQDTRILIVDDDQNAREILQEYLAHWGMRSTTAESALQALEVLNNGAKTDPFMVAIIDMAMPDTDGLQFCKTIRESADLKNIKLILNTAFDKPGVGQEAISIGFDAYLTKPVRQSELLDAIMSVVLESKRRQASPEETQLSLPEGVVPPLQSLRRSELLLIAEDHPINQEVALLLMQDLGFEAHIAENGQKVIDLLERIPYAVVFMDCQMPVMNGFDATLAIRKDELRTGKHLPIIAVTAHAIEGSREQCLAAGMDDYISKPISIQQLKLTLDKWVPPANQIESVPQTVVADNWLDKLHQRYGKQAGEGLLELFAEEVPEQVKQLREAIENRHKDELLMLAHGLKGICQTVFAADMSATCSEIETKAYGEEWDAALSLVLKLEHEFESVQMRSAEPPSPTK